MSKTHGRNKWPVQGQCCSINMKIQEKGRTPDQTHNLSFYFLFNFCPSISSPSLDYFYAIYFYHLSFNFFTLCNLINLLLFQLSFLLQFIQALIFQFSIYALYFLFCILQFYLITTHFYFLCTPSSFYLLSC